MSLFEATKESNPRNSENGMNLPESMDGRQEGVKREEKRRVETGMTETEGMQKETEKIEFCEDREDRKLSVDRSQYYMILTEKEERKACLEYCPDGKTWVTRVTAGDGQEETDNM